MSGEIKFELAQDIIAELNSVKSFANQWIFIPTQGLEPKAKAQAYRLNALGSLYYFLKVVLRKHRYVYHLHKLHICDHFETEHAKLLIEIPRAHFKSTTCSEGAPMWWALPFTERDEQLMRKLGYGDEWIRWMKIAHNQNTRTLLVSENITNASMLGRRIALHYESNYLFRALYPEILPDSSCPWSVHSYTHKRNISATAQGEGTYDFIGVGGALQSRHYNRIVQDDLVGREALNSEKTMNDTIEYHQLLVGAFDSDPMLHGKDNDEYIVGNRWSYWDLNSYLRKEEPWFRPISHSALGGCCDAHPKGQIIFPEEFSPEKLEVWHKRLKTYQFSCQFLNSPTLPGQTKFKEEWLNYYRFETVSKEDTRVKIVHETKNGQVPKDLMPGNLDDKIMILDPNHAEEDGSCNHALGVIGWLAKLRRFYLLDLYSGKDNYDELCEYIYKFGTKWKLKECYMEDIAGQRILRYPLAMRAQTYVRKGLLKYNNDRPLKLSLLKVDKSKDAKKARIEAMETIYNGTDGTFWIRRISHTQFEEEYLKYPHAGTKDILDMVGYAPQILNVGMTKDEVDDFLRKQSNKWNNGTGRSVVTGY